MRIFTNKYLPPMILVLIFIIGYLLITLEHQIGLNKAGTALVTGVLCWTAWFAGNPHPAEQSTELMEHLGEISGILFFLLGAMTVVELIDAHDGFFIVTKLFKTLNKRKLLVIVSVLSFFLSAVLDNLTTTILMVSILRKLVETKEDRWYFTGFIIIAANAGGAWSPIGDVTTTMLWIGGQLTTTTIIAKVLLPATVSLALPLFAGALQINGNVARPGMPAEFHLSSISPVHRNVILISGLSILVLIPVFKTVTHLPPFMGMMLGLGLLWIISEILHKDRDTEDKDKLSVVYALRKIDSASILFFLGILLAVTALQSAGFLERVATYLDQKIGNMHLIATLIGLFSAVVDNVPLVAASIGMYDLSVYPTDHVFWQLLAYTTGTGGSVLIIGSAAGVAAMGMEGITFSWYLKKISWLALLGFAGGAGIFVLIN